MSARDEARAYTLSLMKMAETLDPYAFQAEAFENLPRIAALLDEPETDWEYGIRVRVPDSDFGDDGYGAPRYELRPMNFYEVNTRTPATHRRRRAGRWEPVESEAVE